MQSSGRPARVCSNASGATLQEAPGVPRTQTDPQGVLPLVHITLVSRILWLTQCWDGPCRSVSAAGVCPHDGLNMCAGHGAGSCQKGSEQLHSPAVAIGGEGRSITAGAVAATVSQVLDHATVTECRTPWFASLQIQRRRATFHPDSMRLVCRRSGA